MRARRALIAALTSLMLLSAAPVQAITFGELDGNDHPNVGSMVVVWPEFTWQVCSGTLISPTVFLTASHCLVWLEPAGVKPEQVFVTFDETLDEDAALVHGTPHSHPGYGHDSANLYDVGVIVLDEPVTGITPAALPTENLLDTLALRSQRFVTVGYGGVRDAKQKGPQAIYYEDPPQRRWAEQGFLALNKAWLRLSMNPSTGSGGTCYGDSGGPHFLAGTDVVVSVTVTGDTPCRATDTTYRVDTPWARAFLDDFVTLP